MVFIFSECLGPETAFEFFLPVFFFFFFFFFCHSLQTWCNFSPQVLVLYLQSFHLHAGHLRKVEVVILRNVYNCLIKMTCTHLALLYFEIDGFPLPSPR